MNSATPEPSQPAREDKKSETPFETFHAPNGLQIFHHAAAETKYVYQEIFEERVYFRHGIDLLAGETVFDIGANIGMFTIFAKENFKDVVVHAFEPSPVIFRILKANVAKYGSAVTVHPCGMAAQTGEATFTFYPHYSIMSGFHAQTEQDREALRAGISSHLAEQGANPAGIQNRFLNAMVNNALNQKQEYACPLRTVSEIIDEARVPALGLLKIDAEGSELDILAGIRGEHWPRIRQIVMELHDPTGTLRPTAKDLLEKKGYTCAFEEEKRLSGSGILNCYARRA